MALEEGANYWLPVRAFAGQTPQGQPFPLGESFGWAEEDENTEPYYKGANETMREIFGSLANRKLYLHTDDPGHFSGNEEAVKPHLPYQKAMKKIF